MFFQLSSVTWEVFQINVGNKMWNYRIIKREVEGQPDQYGLFEVMYNDDKQISAHAEEAEITCESPEEIIESLSIMLSDAIRCKELNNTLTYDKIEFFPFCDEKDWEAISMKEFEDLINEQVDEEKELDN